VYSIFENFKSDQVWFESVIFNFWLWGRCDPLSLEKVLSHWVGVLLLDCLPLLQAKPYFTPFLVVLDAHFPPRAGYVRARTLLLRLLNRLAHIKFTKQDEDALSVHAKCSADAETAASHLEILRNVSGRIDGASLSGLVARFSDDPMQIAFNIVRDHTELFECILSNLGTYPRLCEIGGMLALSVNREIGHFLLEIVHVPGALVEVSRKPTWFVWPVLLAMQRDWGERRALLRFLAAVALSSVANIELIAHFLVYAELKVERTDPGSLLHTFVNEITKLPMDLEMVNTIVSISVWNFCVKLCPSAYTRGLLAEFEHSPFDISGFEPIVPERPEPIAIRDAMALLEFAKLPFAAVFRPAIQWSAEMAFVDQTLLGLAGSLVQTCERQKYADILRHFRAKATRDDRYPQVEPIDRAMEAITVEFSGRLQKSIEGLMAAVASRIESARKMHDTASKKNVWYSSAEKMALAEQEGRRRDRLRFEGRPFNFEPRRRSAMCAGCPVLIVPRTELPLRSAPGYTPNCSVSILDRRFECHVSVSATEVTVLFPHKKLTVAFDSITASVRRDLSVSEFGTTRGKSYLVSVTKGSHLIPPRSEAAPLQWCSSFDYLLALNRLYGRSFHDIHCYPVFPWFLSSVDSPDAIATFVTRDFHEPTPITSVTKLTQLRALKYVTPEFFWFPELYTGELPCWASTAYEFVYQLRKSLEKPQVRMSLPDWARFVFGEDGHRHKCLANFPEWSPPSVRKCKDCRLQLLHEPLVFAKVSPRRLVQVTASGVVYVYTIEDECVSRLPIGRVEDSFSSDFFVGGDRLWIYDRRRGQIATNTGTQRQKIVIESRRFVDLLSGFVYCPDPFTVFIREPNCERVICRTDTRIAVLAASFPFRSLVFVTMDRKVHFHALFSAREIATIELDEIVHRILITEEWGFVVMHATEHLYVYNVNGTKVRIVEWRFPIRHWTAFSSPAGLDYVAFVEGANNLRSFEVFYPENCQLHCRCPDLMDLHYDPSRARFVLAASTGRVDYVTQLFQE
jgi:hypothetical protein